MRRVTTTCVALCVLVITARADDVLSQLGITPAAAKAAVSSVIANGVYNPGLPAGAFRLLPAAARGEAVAAGVAWLKSYVASPEFKQQYAALREAQKPEPPQFDGTPEDEMKRADQEQQQQAEDSKTALAALPADQRAQVEEALKAAQVMAARMNTPEMRKTRLDAIKTQRADRTARYREELATWTRTYPENAAPVLAKRLREFLAASADVDFAATLTPRNGRMVFENPAYEQKPGQWKLCYRAGKEATGAARAAVQAWLKELGG
jgi:hypothetical protein